MITQEQISEQLKAVIEGVLAAGSDVTQMVNYLAEEGLTLTSKQRQTYTDYIAQLGAAPNTPMPEGFTLRTQDDSYTTPTAKILRSLVNSICLAKMPMVDVNDLEHFQKLTALNHQLQIYLEHLIAPFKNENITIPLNESSPVYQALAAAIAQNGAKDNLAFHTKVIHDRFLYADYVHQSLVTYRAHLEKMQTPPAEKIEQVETLADRFADTDRTSIIPTADENTLIVEALKHGLNTRIDVTLQDKEAQATQFIREIIDHRFEGVFDDRNSGIDHVLTRYSDPNDRLKAQLYGFRPKLAQRLGEITEIRELRTSAANTTDIDTIKALQHRLDILPHKHQIITYCNEYEQQLRYSAAKMLCPEHAPLSSLAREAVETELTHYRQNSDYTHANAKLQITIEKLYTVNAMKQEVQQATTREKLTSLSTTHLNQGILFQHRDGKTQLFALKVLAVITSLGTVLSENKQRRQGYFNFDEEKLVQDKVTSSKNSLFAPTSAKKAAEIQEVIKKIPQGSRPSPAAAA